jgi:micrococcal nuclease
MTLYEYQAHLDRVVDGDTVDLIVDLGFSTFEKQRFRLLGLNADEHDTVKGDAATAWLAKRLPVGALLRIQTVKTPKGDKREKYGRFLATLFEPPQATASVNSELVAHHEAKTWDGKGKRPT